MSLPEISSIKSPNFLRIFGWFLLLLAILLVATLWPASENKEGAIGTSKTNSNFLGLKRAESKEVSDMQGAPLKPKLRREALRQIGLDTSKSAIAELLANDQLSHDETARQLADIALNPNLPEAERLEAMEHAKNLGFSNLLSLSSDPNLPLPLAESFLQCLHGHDQIKEQVSGALGLLNHADADIREQTQTFLGFLLKAEEYNEAPEKLREKADVFLKQPDEESGSANEIQ